MTLAVIMGAAVVITALAVIMGGDGHREGRLF
jgi:hypothetical protein